VGGLLNIGSLPWKEVASQGTLEISSRCQGTALPYFRRVVTCGEMCAYEGDEGGLAMITHRMSQARGEPEAGKRK
jgi:hypothetical protein